MNMLSFAIERRRQRAIERQVGVCSCMPYALDQLRKTCDTKTCQQTAREKTCTGFGKQNERKIGTGVGRRSGSPSEKMLVTARSSRMTHGT